MIFNKLKIFALNKTTALHQRRGVPINDGMIKTYSWILFNSTIISKHNFFRKSSNYL